MNNQVIQLCQTMLQGSGGSVIREQISGKVDEVLSMPTFKAGCDRELIIRKLEELFTVWTDEAQVLSNDDSHTPWLAGKKGEIEWSFWNRYKLQLSKSLPPAAVDSIDEVTRKVLEQLEDPVSKGPWDRRGLVMGNVQSGKTANYTGLICKAADAGYKVVIVLAGLHNNLRSQTQIRLDEGFLGYRASARKGDGGFEITGVGHLDRSLKADSVTNRHNNGDFSKAVANQFAISPGGFPLLFVVKKNVSVLNNLLSWIRAKADVEDPETGRKFHKETPLLVIDDESDQASVDTGKVPLDENGIPDEEHNPTKTNALIRKLLYSFGKSAYVGYTATPFANIFIHELNETKNEGQDLFPRSFIVNIPPPSNYTGAARIFGIREDEETQLEAVPSLPITREIDDYAVKRNANGEIDDDGWVDLAETEGWMPPKLLSRTDHIPRYENEEKIPPSLREAIMAFILATTVREMREGLPCHNSMLVHVMRYTKVQARVAVQITQALKEICLRLEHGDGERVPTIIDEFKELWESDFVPTSTDPVFAIKDFDESLILPGWSEVEDQLRSVAASIEVRSINGSAADVLDYESYTERGLNVIAVGADKLSRGLTLEGLTVSYFLRASKMYDTLMQMGRWFGYRGKYIDVCRLYTTSELIEWFTHIAAASEELRQEFDYMVNVGGTPRDYGLKVRSHPVLLVTSAVKMRSGTELRLTYSGDISETIIFDTSVQAIKRNWDATLRLLGDLASPGTARSTEKAYFWRNVDVDHILTFLDDFHSHPDARRADSRLLSSYIRRQVEQDELTDWSVLLVSSSLSSRSYAIPSLGHVSLIKRSQYPPLPEDPSEKSRSRYTIRRLLSPSDEWQDLEDEEYESALSLSVKNWEESTRKEKSTTAPTTPGGRETRKFRSKQRGFLILYPIDGREAHVEAEEPVMGMAISFPYSDTAKEISYRVNNVFTDAGDIDSI